MSQGQPPPPGPQTASSRPRHRIAASIQAHTSFPVEAPGGAALEIDLDALERNPYQTRSRFDEAALAELAQSIAATGVVQPVVVRSLSRANTSSSLVNGDGLHPVRPVSEPSLPSYLPHPMSRRWR